MKFTLENSAGAHLVRSHGPDGIRVGETLLTSSCLLSAETIDPDWPVAKLADLNDANIAVALALQPELIVLGTGPTIAFPHASVQAAVQSAGVGFEVMDTGAACRTYNVLVSEGRRVVAALIVNKPD